MTLSFDINAVDETLRHQFVARAELISTISKQRRFDFIVIGGGIHGAAFARLAALNNLSVLLLERGDYASQTSSRSSKLAHGGLRYLEMFDFIQVFEGIQAREELFEVAHHLVKPQQFVIPIPQHDWYLQSKIWLGLLLYDLMTGKWSNIKRHRFHSIKDLAFQFLRENRLSLSGCFSYMDGILNDSRLVIDNILSTRQEGGQALNYAEVMRVLQLKSSASSLVHWQDKLTGKQYEAEAGLVINCAGPWVSKIEGVRPSAAEDRICYSQGAHLLFNKPWRDPALFLPIDNKGRYYFVLPHFAGTLSARLAYSDCRIGPGSASWLAGETSGVAPASLE